MSTPTIEPIDVLKRAHAVGTYYGFESLSSAAHKNRGNSKKEAFPDSLALDTLDPHARDVAGFLKTVRDAGLSPSAGRPHFFWHTNAAAGRPAPKQLVIQFHALGADRAIADAVLIRAVRSLAADITKQEARLRLNSMGDRETRGRLARELSSFFRKRGNTLPADCAESAKKDVFAAAELLIQTPEKDGMPSPTDHLSEASRKHFESVLEYLEATETPYELAPDLLSRGGIWNETCFEITAGDRFQAWGSRYNDLAKHFFKSIPSSVGAVIRITTDVPKGKPATVAAHKATSPRFVFVHIGDEAKRESIKMADTLRKARVPMTQVLGVESLTEQMRLADELDPRYLIIMGRKEALERSVILRERATHTETFIPFDTLIDRLRAVA